MTPLHCTILASTGGISATIGLAVPGIAPLTIIGGAMFLYGTSACIGRIALPAERGIIQKMLGFLGVLALLAVSGAGVYWVYALNIYSISGLLIVLPWVVFTFSPFAPPRSRKVFGDQLLTTTKTYPADTISLLLLMTTLGFDVIALRWLFGAATSEAIRSPWDVVPPIFFLWIFLGTLTLIILVYRNRNHHLSLLAASIHLFTILSPALLVYKIGFGFDPFIHIATEKLIAAAGAVTPKPPYYLGQYALVTILSKLSHLPVGTVDRLMVPVLAAVYLPLGTVYLLRRSYKLERHLAVLAMLGVFLIPISSFISTTPQSLANLFSILTFLIGMVWLHSNRPPLVFVLLLVAAAVATHPLSGIPAVLFMLFLTFFKLRRWKHLGVKAVKATTYLALFIGATIATPFLFVVNSHLQKTGPALTVNELIRPFSELVAAIPAASPGIESRFRPLLDFAELISRNYPYILILLAAGGIIVLARQKNYRRTVWVTGSLGVALLINVVLLNTGVAVGNVIDYEQRNYGNRLFELTLMLLVPLMLAAFAWWWRRLRQTTPSLRIFSVLLLAAVITALTYAIFPRNDAFEKYRGLSVSEHDIKAVRHINTNARAPYIVLANQSVSAAALQEFGFKTYYGDQFYYPIPTGAPLYQYYLDMVYKTPSPETMNAAMRSVNVPRAFFVINRYWTNSEKIIETAKTNADQWVSIDSGELFIFEYRIKP